MRRHVAVAAVLLAGLPAGGSAAAAPCALAWADPAGDTVYTTGTGLASPAAPDDDLDARAVTLRATATELIASVKVTSLDPNGPSLGTGHGLGLVLTKYGKTMAFAATRDATFGDRATGPDAASKPALAVDAATGTFTLTVRRADIARVAGTPVAGGDLTGVYVSTLRHDPAQAAVNATPVGAGRAGLPADDTTPREGGATLSLDACDAALRRSVLTAKVSGGGVDVTLADGAGTRLGNETIRILRDGRAYATARLRPDGTSRIPLLRAGTYTLVYAGRAGHDPARVTVRR